MFFFEYELRRVFKGHAMYVSIFQTTQIWKEIMLELNGKAFKCYHVFNWIFLPKPEFLEFIWMGNHNAKFANQRCAIIKEIYKTIYLYIRLWTNL